MLFFQSLRKLTRKWYSYTSRVEIRRCLKEGEPINIALYRDYYDCDLPHTSSQDNNWPACDDTYETEVLLLEVQVIEKH